MKFYLVLLLFCASVGSALSQSFSVSGEIKDQNSQEGVPLATVGLLTAADSTLTTGVVTDLDGSFIISSVQQGNYILEVKYLGYETKLMPIKLQQNVQLGPVFIQEESHTLDQVVIQGEASMSIQKGDTTQYNASAFTTLSDASGQDLVEKMPGITVQDGKLQAQGEDVQQILIDGKPFFGNDVQAALQSLPADVIESVQVFDKKSEQAELSGFDDGNEAKTINIVTKPDRKRGQFGKTTAGYGLDNKYQLGASVNFFDNDSRTTVTGLSNNINAVKYTADPNSRGDSRTQDGIITTNNIGIQYSNTWDEKLELSGSYQYSNRANEGEAFLLRQYVLDSDAGQVYKEESQQDRLNQDHNFRLKMEYDLDDRNKFIMIPSVELTHDNNTDGFQGSTKVYDELINATANSSTADDLDFDAYNRLFYNHKFRKEGRTITLRSEIGYHTNVNRGRQLAENIYYNDGTERIEDLKQDIELDRTGLNWGFRGSYTEPMGERGLWELEYNIRDKVDDSDRLNYNIIEEQENEFAVLDIDTALSNTFDSRYLSQEAELGYQYKTEKFRAQAEVEFQKADLMNHQYFPATFDQARTFTSVLPTLRMNYKFSKNTNVEFNYFTWTVEPSIGNLQNVINNANPLKLRTGNPELDQTYNHRLRARFRARNTESEESLYAAVQTSIIEDYVTQSTFIADEAVEVADGIILEEGSQLIRPVNVEGYWNMWSYVNYGRPITWIQSNVNVFASVGFTRRPGVINDVYNFSNSKSLRFGISLSSNINDQIDFNISTRSSFNQVDNSINTALNNNFFNQSTRLRYNWIIWKGLVYRTYVNHRLNTGLAEGYNNSFVLVNMSLGKKFLKQDRGELSLNVYDLFAQNNNIHRSVGELYIQDRQSTVLQRYFMLSFTYNIRHFSKGTTIDDYDI